MEYQEIQTYIQGPMTVTATIILVALLEQLEIPIYVLGPIATIAIVAFSIVTRYGLFDSTQNSGPDLAFCAVGLQLAFFYKKMEQPISGTSFLAEWDMIFLIFFLTLWMVSLILIREAPHAKVRLRYINPYSVGAATLGFLSILLQIYWRLLCQL